MADAGVSAQPVASSRSAILPAELVAVVERTSVFFRQSRSEDDDAAPIVWAPGLGRWPWNGSQHAADRIAKVWPDLTERQAMRAAKLLSSQIDRQARNQFAPHRSRGLTAREMFDDAERKFLGQWG